ncbi:hypothetical protein DENIS_1699 [Desulfonema ishimotonii]|uniref:histidine kinase n=1 Tax=Desulfonema ishimotonii TaxID=45657 RepID=A0A401FUV2_9BACT|nr:PAS domain S-box protein [Desulfonema ishimotonii]GBC60740.1 hypothetical protein DENIS_1699 [Desulfonema ishimotonii]
MNALPDAEKPEQKIRQLEQEVNALRRSNAALRQSEKRYRFAMEAANEGLWDWNLKTNEVYFTPRYYTMLGYRPYEMPPAFTTWKNLLHPGDRETTLGVLNDYLAQKRKTFEVEFRIKTKSGEWRWILGKGKIVEWDDAGKPVRLIGVHADIHRHKQQEARINQLNTVLHTMREVSHLILREKDRKQMIQGICDTLIHTCGYQSVWIALLNSDTKLTKAAECGLGENFLKIFNQLKRGRLMDCAREARKNGRAVLSDHSSEKCRECPVGKNYSESTSAIIPLRYGETDYGLICLSFPGGFKLDERERELMENMAGDIAFCLYSFDREEERQRTEAALRRYEAIISNVRDSIALVDRNYIYRIINPTLIDFLKRFEKLSDMSLDTVAGRSMPDVLERELFEVHLKPQIDRCFAGESVPHQLWSYGSGNDGVFMDRGYYPVVENDGTISGVIISSRDITELKRTEASLVRRTCELRERIKELNCLVGISVLLEKSDISTDKFFDTVVRFIRSAFQYPEITCVCIRLADGRKFLTDYFKETPWGLATDIIVRQEYIGCIEVFYSERKWPAGEVPFLPEEQVLLFSISERLGKVLDRKHAEKALQESEARYRAMFENMSSGVAVYKAVDSGRNFVFVDFNKASERMDQIRRENVIGKRLTDVFRGVKEFGLLRILERVWVTGRPEEQPLRYYADDRISGWRRGFVYKLASGEIVTLYTDETRQKEAELALQESEKRFRDLVESSPVGIAILQSRKLVYQNPAQRRLKVIDQRAIFPDFDHIYPDDVEKVKRLYGRFVSYELQNLETDFRFYPLDREIATSAPMWINCRISRITFRGEEALLLNMIDVTRAREMEKLIRVQDKMTSLGRVTAGIAHEIRNPLSGINIYLDALEQLLGEYDFPEGTRRILDKIQSASAKIESIIKRVMDFSRPGEPRFARINLRQPVEDAIHLTAVTLEKSGIDLRQNITPDLPMCNADRQMIEQVMLNLINNAMEAVKEACDDKIIQISAFKENGNVCVSVSDSGPGVPAGTVNNIFDPFYSTKQRGTGIGLSLCHRIITDHGGTLRVTPSQWGGAEFTLKIPVKRKLK